MDEETSFAAAVARLASAGIEAPEREARSLLAHALGRTPESLIGERPPPPPGFASLVSRRAAREPLAFILGRREFWSLCFAVSPATLIPRPESETLLEAALAARPDRAAVRRVLDLGTGTGCLLLAALSEFPAAFGVGVDRVAEAAALARGNAEALGLAGRAAFLVGDWATSVAGRFDLVLANPPYVERASILELMPEVARFEPRSALDGGEDGLDAYRRLMPAVRGLLAERGIAILELGIGGAEGVARLAAAEGLAVREARADLSGNRRALVLGLGGPLG
jgi:release factor glutamine methyltransferase